MTGPDEFARAEQRRVHGRFAFADVAFDVFDDDDGVVHDKADRQHDGQQRQQVQREAEHLHQEHRADERERNRHQRNQHRAERAEKQENHDRHNDERDDQRLHHFVQRVGNILGRVVGHARREAGRQIFLDRAPSPARTRLMTSSELAFGKAQTPMNTARSPLKRTSES